ncbi:hypothetical protein ACX122_16100 [Kosakonia cowanii]
MPYPAYGVAGVFLPDGGGFVGRVSAAPPGNFSVGHKAQTANPITTTFIRKLFNLHMKHVEMVDDFQYSALLNP